MRVKSEARRNGIVEAAMAVFLEKGFEAASMSDIAARAGGSKATLYSYFASKEELYVEVMDGRCSELFERAFGSLTFDGDLRSTLLTFACSLYAVLLTPDMLAVRRNILAQAGRSDIGRLFYERGPKQGLMRLADFIGQQMAAGRLRRADPWQTTLQLMALLDSDLTLRALLGVDGMTDPAALERHLAAGLEVFLRAFAPERPSDRG